MRKQDDYSRHAGLSQLQRKHNGKRWETLGELVAILQEVCEDTGPMVEVLSLGGRLRGDSARPLHGIPLGQENGGAEGAPPARAVAPAF